MEKASNAERRAGLDRWATKFILRMEGRDEPLDMDTYVEEFKNYVRAQQDVDAAAAYERVERALRKIILVHVKRIPQREWHKFSLESAIGTGITLASGALTGMPSAMNVLLSMFLLSPAVVPPFQAVVDRMSGKQVRIDMSGDTAFEKIKNAVLTSQRGSSSAGALNHASRIFWTGKLLALHRRAGKQLNIPASQMRKLENADEETI